MKKDLWTKRSTFAETALEKDGACTACDRHHAKGAVVLLKTYQNKVNHRQTIRVILCNDECWQEYDFNFWEARTGKDEDKRLVEQRARIYDKADREGYGFSTGLVADARESELLDVIRQDEQDAMRNYEV